MNGELQGLTSRPRSLFIEEMGWFRVLGVWGLGLGFRVGTIIGSVEATSGARFPPLLAVLRVWKDLVFSQSRVT